MTSSKRLSPSDRKELIVATALQLVAEYGIQGTTIERIADEVGMSQGGLYRHFHSRTEILLAVVDRIFQQIFALFEVQQGTDPLVQLREITRRHTCLMSDENVSFARPWLEFIAAAPRVGLRRAVAEKQRTAIVAIAEIVDRGKQHGSIRADVDSRQLAWEILSWCWGENVSSTMALDEFIDEGRSSRMIDILLHDAATR
jgi:AcrR family transcriptional regulator